MYSLSPLPRLSRCSANTCAKVACEAQSKAVWAGQWHNQATAKGLPCQGRALDQSGFAFLLQNPLVVEPAPQ